VGILALAGCVDHGQNNLDGAVPIGSPTGTPDPTGDGSTVFANGDDPANAFFVSLGTNGRTCASCHDATAGWSVTPAFLAARFAQTDGLDPVFRPNDGAGSPNADVTTSAARSTAYSLLLAKGLFRIGLPIPAGAEFTLVTVDDPYGYASATELSLFRRPVPSTNLRFKATIMWDGREATLATQATDATLGHAQATSTVADQIAEIVAFESSLFTAQTFDNGAGDLALGANGGPTALAQQPYTPGATSPQTFTLYGAWANDPNVKRAAIARGEVLFNTHRFQIRGVAGLSDRGVTCSTCHDTPNVGSHSSPLPVDIGISDASRRAANLPLYTLKNSSTGATIQTSDPGLALTTGKWADIGRFEIPSLRGVAMRPPYFHDGFAATLADVVEHYDDRFDIHLDPNERADLVAFLEAI
jgi:cytochrome c peroxidase